MSIRPQLIRVGIKTRIYYFDNETGFLFQPVFVLPERVGQISWEVKYTPEASFVIIQIIVGLNESSGFIDPFQIIDFTSDPTVGFGTITDPICAKYIQGLVSSDATITELSIIVKYK